jgi:pimeloyl-ACP methyl ester carboxylesterase
VRLRSTAVRASTVRAGSAVAALAVAAGPAIGTSSGGPAAARPVSARVSVTSGAGLAPYISKAKWRACAHGIPKPFQCASEPVPLNYRQPAGRRLQITMVRLSAADPKKRIGSLFVNFAGPGGAGVSDLVARADTVFSAAVRARFDLVSWDPRGIEYSAPVNCFASLAASQAYFNSDAVFPYPQSQEPAFFALNAQLGQDCKQHSAALLAHISSADTARDLHLLRQDVGDSKLTYLGFSYGSVVGATYANLFPSNVRAMVLDGTLDFTGNVTGDQAGVAARLPIDVRQGVPRAGQDVFNRFLALCARAKGKCAFSAGGKLPAKWATLLSRARAGQLNYQNLMIFAYYDLEKPIADWPGLATFLQGLYTSTSAGHALTARQETALAAKAGTAARQSLVGAPPVRGATRSNATRSNAGRRPQAAVATYADNTEEAFYAIQCADSLVPTKTSVYHNLANSEDTKVPGFGRLIVYDTMPCASWPAMHTDAYNGPWNRSRTTILVINALHDPFTPIWGARTGVRELHNARLLTVNGDGHTSMFVEPSTCRANAELAYLASRKLPARGAVCQVNALPFGLRP